MVFNFRCRIYNTNSQQPAKCVGYTENAAARPSPSPPSGEGASEDRCRDVGTPSQHSPYALFSTAAEGVKRRKMVKCATK